MYAWLQHIAVTVMLNMGLMAGQLEMGTKDINMSANNKSVLLSYFLNIMCKLYTNLEYNNTIFGINKVIIYDIKAVVGS